MRTTYEKYADEVSHTKTLANTTDGAFFERYCAFLRIARDKNKLLLGFLRLIGLRKGSTNTLTILHDSIMISGVNHLGIAVRNLETSMDLFQKIFRVESFHRETVADQKVDIASFKLGDVLVELTAPTDADSPIAKFLEKRGEGIHHIAFTTEGVNEELQRLAESGVQLINSVAQKGAHDMMIAFLHPKSTNGVLMELCEPPKSA